MATVAEINKKIADAEWIVKNSKAKLSKLRNDLRVYTSAEKLSDAQIKAAKKINEQITEEEKKATKAQNDLNSYNSKISDLKSIEDIDSELEIAINNYKKAQSLGGKPTKSEINRLLDKRKGLEKSLGTLAPKAPQLPEEKTTNVPTGTMAKEPTGTAIPQGGQKATTATTSGKPSVTGTMPTMPSGAPAGGAVSSSFNPAAFRAGEDASMGGGTVSTTATATPTLTGLQTLLKKTEFWYDLPDYLFETVPGLGDILVEAVANNWDDKKFMSKVQLLPWWQSTASVFREKIIQKAKYNELRAAGNDVTKTEYGQSIAKLIRSVKAQAKSIAGVALDDAQAQLIAEKIYDGNLEEDPLAINRLIIPYIGKVTDRYAGSDVTTYGGDALKNYQMLQAIAKANGLTLKDILPQISTALTGGDLEKAVLQALAAGDIDLNRVAQNARMVAAQGQPEYVRNLLNQGYDLEQVYAPYKNTMAAVLELNPDQIDLNDPTLRGAINNNGDMNIYDFKKALRKDSRWQYTSNAREEVSNATLQVLRDFGFQG